MVHKVVQQLEVSSNEETDMAVMKNNRWNSDL